MNRLWALALGIGRVVEPRRWQGPSVHRLFPVTRFRSTQGGGWTEGKIEREISFGGEKLGKTDESEGAFNL